MKLILWHSGEVDNGEKALDILARLYGTIEIVGAHYDLSTTGGRMLRLDDKVVPILNDEAVANQAYDYILATGRNVEFGAVLRETASLGINADRVLLNRAVCIPGFTLEKYNRLRRSKLTIFSQNCAGGIMAHTMGLPFLSPMVNMWMPWGHFLEFLRHSMDYVQITPVFGRKEHNSMNGIDYPVYMLDSLELHMNHCPIENKESGLEDWENRKKRINWFNIMLLAGTANPQNIEQFDELPYVKKICFTGIQSTLDSAYYIGKDADEFTSQIFANKYAKGEHIVYDMWDIMLYGKKTNIN